MINPFSLSFGKEPLSEINREQQESEIITGFTAENPEFHAAMITGVRGSGKTVLMTKVAAEIKKNKDWIVVELNPERDILYALAADLSSRKELMQIFKDAKLSISAFGFGIEIDSEPPITDVVVALDRMLAQLTSKGKKVLVAIDETASNKNIREFTGQFQIYVRKNYNIFLLMTGLYENIYELQNEKTLTFLYRAPKFEMGPLNSKLVAKKYCEIFSLSEAEAQKMADIVKGYPYAFQVLGYLCYKRSLPYSEVLDEFDAYLEEYVYDKIWSELSKQDQKVVAAMAESSSEKVEDIRKVINMSSAEFSVYRKRLIKKGLVNGKNYGHLTFSLPRFEKYVKQAAQII